MRVTLERLELLMEQRGYGRQPRQDFDAAWEGVLADSGIDPEAAGTVSARLAMDALAAVGVTPDHPDWNGIVIGLTTALLCVWEVALVAAKEGSP